MSSSKYFEELRIKVKSANKIIKLERILKNLEDQRFEIVEKRYDHDLLLESIRRIIETKQQIKKLKRKIKDIGKNKENPKILKQIEKLSEEINYINGQIANHYKILDYYIERNTLNEQ